jgi:uncharacterized lipoprotein YajG
MGEGCLGSSKLLVLGLIVAAASSLSACTFTAHDLQVKPTVQPVASSIGQGTRVFFRFVDDRDDVTIGHRGVGSVGAKISSADLPQSVEAQLRDELQKKLFDLVSSEADSDASVTYRLRSFKFDIEQGFFSGGRNAAAALAVDAQRGSRTYANVYRYNSEERIMFVPGGDEIDNQMNAALNQILTKADSDEALDRLLTGQ